MSFNQTEYVSEYNKNNYKMYQFRVKKSDKEIIELLDNAVNRNSYILSLINKDVFTLKEIKNRIKPILHKYAIFDIYLFGSYARGEATISSDVDIYCERGKIETLVDEMKLIEELELSLNKKVDIVYTDSKMEDYFKNQIMEDMIKLC